MNSLAPSPPPNGTQLLIDLLPPPSEDYYDDRENESELVEDLRRGYISVVVSVPMDSFLAQARARLNLPPDVPPTYADWARFRLYVQDMVRDYVTTLALPGFGSVNYMVRLGSAGERPDVHNVRTAYDESFGQPHENIPDFAEENDDDEREEPQAVAS